MYFVAALSALYFVIAPTISGERHLGPVFVTTLFWCSAILFFAATFWAKRPLGYGLAVVGGTCLTSLYFCAALVRLGYFRVEYRLVALPHAIPSWRFTLDKPVFLLLLISTFASLVGSVPLLIAYVRVKLHAGSPN